MSKTCWALCTKGMGCVGQDEFVILLAFNEENEDVIPRDIFLQLHYIYQEAAKGGIELCNDLNKALIAWNQHYYSNIFF